MTMSWRALLISCLLIAPASAQAAGWTTSGVNILDPAGQPFVISSINWYGAETRTFAPHGLWSQNYTTILDQVKALGFSTIRLPYANETWQKNPKPSPNNVGGCPACQGKRARDILALVVNYAGSIGLHVVIDNHRSDGGNSAQANGLWYYTSGKNTFTEQKWISRLGERAQVDARHPADAGRARHDHRQLSRLGWFPDGDRLRPAQRAPHGLSGRAVITWAGRPGAVATGSARR